MRRREFLAALCGATAVWRLPVYAQQAVPVIGFLHSRGPEDAAHIVAGFQRALRDAGFIDGQNVRIEYRWARGQFDRLATLAQELVRIPASVPGGRRRCSGRTCSQGRHLQNPNCFFHEAATRSSSAWLQALTGLAQTSPE